VIRRTSTNRGLVGIAILFLASFSASAAAPNLDDLVRLWAAATGGLARIRALHAVRMTGRITLAGTPNPFLVEIERPGKIRTQIDFPEGRRIQVFDGKKGWSASASWKSRGAIPMNAEQLANAPEQADIDGPLVDSAKKGITLALEGPVKVDGKDAFRIRVTRANGRVRYLDLDATTSLKVRWEGELGEGEQRKMNASLFSDYRTVSGLAFPFRIRSGVLGEAAQQEIVFEKIEVNPTIPESDFEPPK